MEDVPDGPEALARASTRELLTKAFIKEQGISKEDQQQQPWE